ncbi:hypothetical protein RUND412_011411 [Rhizina undulata]
MPHQRTRPPTSGAAPPPVGVTETGSLGAGEDGVGWRILPSGRDACPAPLSLDVHAAVRAAAQQRPARALRRKTGRRISDEAHGWALSPRRRSTPPLLRTGDHGAAAWGKAPARSDPVTGRARAAAVK